MAKSARLAPGGSTLAESLYPTQIGALRVPETQLELAPRQLAALKAARAAAWVHAGAASEAGAAMLPTAAERWRHVTAPDYRMTACAMRSQLADELQKEGSTTVGAAAIANAGSLAWETSAKQGEPPSPETIAHGTVRMEDHPDCSALLDKASAEGVVISYGNKARVKRTQFVDGAGEPLEIRLELQLVRGMRYLDLEHEMGHIRQLERFGDARPITGKVVRRDEIEERARDPLAVGVLTERERSIFEYHNRLDEFIRLAERKVPSPLLEECAEELDFWRRAAETAGLGHAGNLNEWAQRYFSDIPELEARCRELGLVLVPTTSRW